MNGFVDSLVCFRAKKCTHRFRLDAMISPTIGARVPLELIVVDVQLRFDLIVHEAKNTCLLYFFVLAHAHVVVFSLALIVLEVEQIESAAKVYSL